MRISREMTKYRVTGDREASPQDPGPRKPCTANLRKLRERLLWGHRCATGPITITHSNILRP